MSTHRYFICRGEEMLAHFLSESSCEALATQKIVEEVLGITSTSMKTDLADEGDDSLSAEYVVAKALAGRNGLQVTNGYVAEIAVWLDREASRRADEFYVEGEENK